MSVLLCGMLKGMPSFSRAIPGR